MKKALVCGVTVLFAGLAQAQDVGTEKTIGLTLAQDMVIAAVEDCSSKGYNVVAVVVDRSGYMKALLRAENARPHAIDIAIRKAHTSAMLGYETRILAENISKGVTPASITNTPEFTSLLGGFPIKAGNEVIGGIGVSGAPGGPLDAACVETAFKKVQGRLK
ncbi:MAG: heme-binding protein [Betaproteobacteria bacterium]